MKLLRKFFFSTVFLVLLIGFMVYQGWYVFNPNYGFKAALLDNVHRVLGDRWEIGELSLGLGSVHVDSLKSTLPESPYEITIDKLTVGYSFASLLKGSVNPEKIAEEITVQKPRLKIDYDSQKQANRDVNLTLDLSDDQAERYQALMKEYDFIKRITIHDGEIVIFDKGTGKETRIAQKINGWASTNNEGKAWLRMAGHVFDSQEYNMVMYGQMDLKRGGLDKINVDFHDYKVTEHIPFLQPGYLDIEGGVINGQLAVTERYEPDRGFNINGDVTLRNGQIKLTSENLFFQDIFIDAEVDNWNIKIKEAHQKINGSPTDLSGRINNVLAPDLDIKLTSSQINISEFLDRYRPKHGLPLQGSANVHVDVTGPLTHPEVRGTLQSHDLRFAKKQIEDFDLSLSLKDLVLSFSEIKGNLPGGALSGKGHVDYSRPERPLDLSFQVSGDFTEELQKAGLVQVARSQLNSEIQVLGTLSEPVSTGSYFARLEGYNRESMDLEGTFTFSDNTGFTVSTSSPNTSFQLDAFIGLPLKNPEVNLSVLNLQDTFKFLNDPMLNFVRDRYQLNMATEGKRDSIKLTFDGRRIDNYEEIFQVSVTRESHNTFSGEVAFLPATESLNGRFDLVLTDSSTQLSNFSIGDLLDAEFDIPRSPEKDRYGKVQISGLKLSPLLAILGQEVENFDGDIYGQVLLNGSSKRPRYRGDLWLLDGTFGQLRPVRGELVFEANADDLMVKKLNFDDAEKLTFSSKGNYNYATNRLDATVAGTHLDLNEIIHFITGRRDIVRGKAMLNISLSGNFPKIPLYGQINVHQAGILDFRFDEVIFDFGKQSNATGSYISEAAFVSGKTRLLKEGEFSLTGKSLLPYKGGHELDVSLSGEGNFFSVLSDLLPELVEDSGSRGQLDLNLTGNYTKPDFSGSHFKFAEGYLELSSVADKVENLQGEVAVLAEDYVLDVPNFTGTIDANPFVIRTTQELPGKYEPLRLGGDDLNLGAIVLSTGHEGVPLNIPALMEEGEVGWFTLEGQPHSSGTNGDAIEAGGTPGDKVASADSSSMGIMDEFFIAGPWEKPVVRGKTYIHNANLMFPFDESAGDGNPVVRNIINNMDWDVVAVARNDTRYERQFPGIYVNMEIEKGNQLDFQGALKDSTFSIDGRLESHRGQIEYFDLNFRVERAGAEFNRSSLYPNVYGRAWTVLRDTSDVSRDIYLSLYSIDETQQEVTKDRYDRIGIRLSSQFGRFEENQKEIMAELGYSSETMDERARSAVGSSTDTYLFRPLFRPLERELERALGLDVVRFSYAVTRNFLNSSFNDDQLNSSLGFLRSSRLVLGKYLSERIYVLYTGELKTDIDYQFVNEKGVGLEHVVGFEYRFHSDWLLQMEYDYNTLLQNHRDDKKVWLRHSFIF